MTNALMENAKEDYNLILRPWQKKSVEFVSWPRRPSGFVGLGLWW
jgi:hypothetical protein